MVKVKICGLTNLEDALFASSCGADTLGFIFSRKSPRYISKQAAKRIISKLDPFLIKTGVFLDENKQKVLDTASCLNLDVLQFHGKETPAYCHFFKQKFKIIKVFFPEDSPFKSKISSYKVDAFLFDVQYDRKIKGTKMLPCNILGEISAVIKSGKRVIVSGGLNVKNIAGIKQFKPYAVDVASGVERSPGRKDRRLVSTFIKRVKYEVT